MRSISLEMDTVMILIISKSVIMMDGIAVLPMVGSINFCTVKNVNVKAVQSYLLYLSNDLLLTNNEIYLWPLS